MSNRLGNDIATTTLNEVNKHINNDNSPTNYARKQLALACKNYLEAENENDNVAFKAFQGILKIVKEGRCPSINAIDDTLGNAPYAIKERSMHKNYIDYVPNRM